MPQTPASVVALEQLPQRKASIYPEPFASRLAARLKRPLGDLFGLTHFGVNITTLPPGAISSIRHAHARQDEFVYIVSGVASLRTNAGVSTMGPGSCAGFKAGNGDAHHLENLGTEPVVYLEIGDRTPDELVSYPDDDIAAIKAKGIWRFFHKDGEPYPGS